MWSLIPEAKSTVSLETGVDLSGAKHLSGQGTTTVLTSESAAGENSLEEPTKVLPRTEAVSFGGTSLSGLFPEIL